jgi:hypothetical protein
VRRSSEPSGRCGIGIGNIDEFGVGMGGDVAAMNFADPASADQSKSHGEFLRAASSMRANVAKGLSLENRYSDLTEKWNSCFIGPR